MRSLRTISAPAQGFEQRGKAGVAQSMITPQILDGLALEAKAREAMARLAAEQMELDRMRLQASTDALRQELKDVLREVSFINQFTGSDAYQHRLTEHSRLSTINPLLEQSDELVRTIRTQQAELDLVNALMMQGGDEASKLIDALSEAAREGGAVGSAIGSINFSSAVAGARQLADSLNTSLHNAMQMRGLLGAAQQAGSDPVILDPRDQRYDADAARLERLRQSIADNPARYPSLTSPRSTPGRRGGGGGAAEAVSDELREAERIYRSTRTALELYNEEMEEANTLLQAGHLDQETYNRYVDQLSDKLRNASGASREMQRTIQSGKDAIIDAVMGQGDAFDRLAATIKRAAYEYLLFGSGLFAPKDGGGFGGILGGLFPSFDNEGYTGNGPRSGGLDGKGGFLSILHPGEDVRKRSRARNSADQNDMVPLFAVDTGVIQTMIHASEARSMGAIRAYDYGRRKAQPGEISDMSARGRI